MPPPMPPPPPEEEGPSAFAGVSKKDPMALVAFVLGILGFCGITGIAAVILGFISKRRIDASGGRLTGRTQAFWGLVLGAVWIGLNIVVSLLVR